MHYRAMVHDVEGGGTSVLQPGDPVPDVAFLDRDGSSFSLASLRGKPFVLYFYPKDDTPGCTAEACAFRDAYQDFTDAGAEVIGVSSDGGASHQRFASKHRLPFRLLTDERGAGQRAFGVSKTLGILPGRVTFVVDARGVVRHAFDSQFMATKHIGEALRALKGISNPV